MMYVMPSPTQRLLTIDDVAAAARRAFGTGISDAAQLAGGSFGSVWRVDLADGRSTVMKAAPAVGAKLLTYEADMLGEEANYLRLAGPVAGVPTAELFHQDDECLFMSHLPGAPLYSLDGDTSVIRAEAGAAIAHLHGVTGDYFGYHGDRPNGATWPDAFSAMIAAMLDDARTWGVRLPVPSAEIAAHVAAQRDVLAAVTTPSLVHFDLWDGNVLTEGGHLSGLVDGERYLWGDPLVDFVSPALFQDIFATPDHPYVHGYQGVRPLEIDESVRIRVRLYRLYLYLLMIVEGPSRGDTSDSDRTAFLHTNFLDALAR
jgi:fructosamine-3-kinase